MLTNGILIKTSISGFFFINHNPSERIINKTNKCMIGRYILTFCVGY